MVFEKLLRIINSIRKKKGEQELSAHYLTENSSLRNDIGFDSLDLAELTVRIEDGFGIDIFEHGNVDTISEILKRLGENE